MVVMATAEQQRRWRARRGARTGHPGRPVSTPCGTLAGYKRHLRHREQPCEPCRKRASADRRERRARAALEGLPREAARSLRLGLAVSEHLEAAPGSVLEIATRNLESMRRADTADHAKRWLDEWERLLTQSPVRIVGVLRSPSDHAIELRQNSPFAGVLDPE